SARDPRDLPSFPTRRSSDLVERGVTAGKLVSGGADINVVESRTPVAFTLNVARGAHVAAILRRYEAASSGAGPRIVSDSLIDVRSEEHTSELQSLRHLVCRL